MHRLLEAGLLLLPLSMSAFAAEPLIDNERVTVRAGSEALSAAAHDFVVVPLDKPGTARFGHHGEVPSKAGANELVIELKDVTVSAPLNPGTYPLAFPRAHTDKLLENDRVVVWSTRWVPGEPTPVHFHDKDALVVYQSSGTLKSSTLDGKSEPLVLQAGKPRFAPKGRVHSETLVSGEARAVITELK